MKIIGVNNMEPSNQGVTVYFDGAEMLYIAEALGLLIEDVSRRDYTDSDGKVDDEFREHVTAEVTDLFQEFVDLNNYLDSINPNMSGATE